MWRPLYLIEFYSRILAYSELCIPSSNVLLLYFEFPGTYSEIRRGLYLSIYEMLPRKILIPRLNDSNGIETALLLLVMLF